MAALGGINNALNMVTNRCKYIYITVNQLKSKHYYNKGAGFVLSIKMTLATNNIVSL